MFVNFSVCGNAISSSFKYQSSPPRISGHLCAPRNSLRVNFVVPPQYPRFVSLFKKKIAQAIEPAAEAAKANKPAAKPNKKKMTFRDAMAKAGKWFRELKSEFKKIVWPSKEETTRSTVVVVSTIVVFAVCIAILDFIFSKGLTLLSHIG